MSAEQFVKVTQDLAGIIQKQFLLVQPIQAVLMASDVLNLDELNIAIESIKSGDEIMTTVEGPWMPRRGARDRYSRFRVCGCDRKEPNMDVMARHQCMIYEGSPATHLRGIAELIMKNLRANQRCLYLNSPSIVAGIRSYLAATGISVARQVSKRSLILCATGAIW